MKKVDVFFPFYFGDYLRDTQHLSTEEHGAYLLLLIRFWICRGSLSDNDRHFAAITRSTLDHWKQHLRPALEPLFQIGNGTWSHKRVVEERLKAENKSKKKSENGRLGGRPRKPPESKPESELKADGLANDKQTKTHSHSHSESIAHTHHWPEAERPGEAEVKAYAQMIGLAEWKAIDWFDEMQGCNWKDYQHRDIHDWRAVLRRVKVKWQSDGQPLKPPSKHGSYNKDSKPNPRNAGIIKGPTDYGEAGRRKAERDAAKVAGEMAETGSAPPPAQ